MTTLLSAECCKFPRNKITPVCLTGIVLQAIIQVTGDGALQGHLAVAKIDSMSPFLCIWLSAFVSFFVAAEFQHGAIRNTLSLGKGRTQVYLSKQASVFIATFAFTFLSAILAVVVSSARDGFGNASPTEFLRFFAMIFLLQLLNHFVYAALFNLFAFISKNAAATALCGVGFIIVEMVSISILGQLGGIGLAIRQAFPYYYVSLLYGADYQIYGYADAAFVTRSIIVSVVSIALISAVGAYIFKRSDIK
ncbi:MAG: ABC transporter permease [Clostridiales bacterium]|jgi:ABC-2 type transport system permease protein|nr:ABC transporter permease [Clostridiales bacterium]